MAFIRELPQDRNRSGVRKGAAPGLVHPTLALRFLLRRLRRLDRPQVLDLGMADGANLEFFTQQGCRVSVEDLATGLPLQAERRPRIRVRRPRAAVSPSCLLAGRRPGPEAFDAVLCWDLLDLLSADEAAGLVREIRDRLRPRGMVWAFFDSSEQRSATCLRHFRILGEESLEHRLRTDHPAARFAHQNRDIIRMFDGFEVLGSTFLRVGMREMLFGRAVASAV